MSNAGWNNETRQFDRLDYLMDGDWYVDENDYLYIVPKSDVIAEIEGPDGEMIDNLNVFCRDNGRNPDVIEAEAMGLSKVADTLKRFNEVDGYYNA